MRTPSSHACSKKALFICPKPEAAQPFPTVTSHAASCGPSDQNGNSLISFISKTYCGLGPKGRLILATSPVHFYLEIKGALGKYKQKVYFRSSNSHHIKYTRLWTLMLNARSVFLFCFVLGSAVPPH